MSVRLRLSRIGRKKYPAYRIVAADQRSPRDGRFIETVGRYQPANPDKTQQIVVDHEKALQWLKNGADPSETVRALLRRSGVLKAYHEFRIQEHKARKAAKPAS
jgi:small subunit ribosomal protein S16